MSLKFICNNELVEENINTSSTVLDYLRLTKNLTGTKEGCREGDCGACTVLVGEISDNILTYKTINSCLMPIAAINGKHLVSIEGLNKNELTPFQEHLVNQGGTQCGFCTPGFVVSFTGYLLTADTYDLEGALDYLTGNLCRCTGHPGIIRAAEIVMDELKKNYDYSNRINYLIQKNILPEYFKNISARLKDIKIFHNPEVLKNYEILVSGGTDIYVQQSNTIADKEIHLAAELIKSEKIKIENNKCIIGSTTTVSELETSNIITGIFKDFKSISKLFGSKQIRNRATIGGNINNASPIGDMTIFFLALNSKIKLTDGKQTREILLQDYFKEYKTLNKNQNEFMVSLSFDVPAGNFKFSFEKVCKRTYLDIASVNTAMYIETENNKIKSAHIAAGGVSPIPLYLKKSSAMLNGKDVNLDLLREFLKSVQEEISPISDARGTADYKRLLLRQLTYSHFTKIFPEKFSQRN